MLVDADEGTFDKGICEEVRLFGFEVRAEADSAVLDGVCESPTLVDGLRDDPGAFDEGTYNITAKVLASNSEFSLPLKPP